MAGVSAVKRLVAGAKEQAASRVGGLFKQLWKLQRSHRNMQSNTEEKKRVSGDTKSGSQCASFLYQNLTLA